MILPKIVYELLPYIYMSAGAAEIGYFSSFLSSSAGLLLFLAGALVWILRSNYRRRDVVSNYRSKPSEGFYELKPFLLIIVAVMLSTWVNSNVTFIFSVFIAFNGAYLIFVRVLNRTREVKYG